MRKTPMHNIPEYAIPNPRIEITENVSEQPAGGFEVCGAIINGYECYVSPLVTSRLIEATVQQNEDRQLDSWYPLPDGMSPPHSVPTMNLLGYRHHVERLTNEGLQILQNVTSPDGSDMQSRLRRSGKLTARVFGTLRGIEIKYKMIM